MSVYLSVYFKYTNTDGLALSADPPPPIVRPSPSEPSAARFAMSKGALGLGLRSKAWLGPCLYPRSLCGPKRLVACRRRLPLSPKGQAPCCEAPTGAGGGRLGLPVRKGSGGNAHGAQFAFGEMQPAAAFGIAQMGGAQFSIAWATPSSRRFCTTLRYVGCVGSVYFKLGELQMTKLVPRYFTLELNI